VGTAGFALVIHPIWFAPSAFFPEQPLWLAVLSGFFVGLIAAQLTEVGCRKRHIPWIALVGSLLGLLVGAVLGSVLAEEIGAVAMRGMSRFAVFIGLAGALAGGLLARGGKR
jgi:hypothetical protein